GGGGGGGADGAEGVAGAAGAGATKLVTTASCAPATLSGLGSLLAMTFVPAMTSTITSNDREVGFLTTTKDFWRTGSARTSNRSNATLLGWAGSVRSTKRGRLVLESTVTGTKR